MNGVMKQMADAFSAFNVNGLNALLYIMQQNIWFVVIAIAAIASMVMTLKREVDYSVNEEQNIL